MAPRPHEGDWIQVQSRRCRRRGRVFERDYSSTSSSHPHHIDGGHWVTTRGAETRAPPHRVQSDDPDFTQKVRVINKLIKAVHHLNNVSKEAYPPSLCRISQNLTAIIKPSSPNLQTLSLIEGNAENWAYTTILILREHYQNNIDLELNRLSQLSTGGWRGPFEIATCWAKRHLGTRLKQETLDRCQRMLTTRLKEPVPPSPPHSVAELTEEPEEHPSFELAPSSPPAAIQPLSIRPHSAAEAHKRSPKKTKKKHTEGDSSLLTPPPSREKPTPAAEPSSILGLQPADAQRVSQEQSSEAPHSTPARRAAHSTAAVQVCRPMRHATTTHKLLDWHLHIRQEVVIMGDSNIGRLPAFKSGHIQVDSFPEATWRDAEFLLKNATCHTSPRTLLLSFGIHQRTHEDKDVPVTEMFQTFKVAEQLFPDATIVIPMIGYSPRLPQQQKAVLDYMNEHIGELFNHIYFSDDSIETEQDNVHWTADTAVRMLKLWSPWLK
ncbi:uncharacterized protein LOC111947055 [Oryzias latipes]|uniref:uncharacterized protein LOC111947055 n=1 Tax=Oryzias latipes TaxID=8090 RepID=UPI000CE1D787|nr:uncharacterized protein LOC111947055 [Oryzias latipes]